jgi:protein transport protein SEC31
MTSVAWNRTATVPHILAGSLSSGSCEIWDLKNKKQVIAFHDPKRCGKSGSRSLAWHPTEPTMIVQACDDDESPVLLLWDLKHYAAPVAVLQGHKRGITSVAWSADDPSLVVSSSRDGSTKVWDVPSASVRSEIAPAKQAVPSADAPYHSEVLFAPLVRGHVATASSDGVIRVHALIDAGPKGRPTAAKPLGNAPNWLKRPCGASFGFGGRLLRFNGTSRSVKIAPVVTDQELVDAAKALQEQAASNEKLAELCEEKQQTDEGEKLVWAQVASRLRGVDGSEAFLTAIDVEKSAPAEESAEDAFEALGDANNASEWNENTPLWGSDAWEEKVGRLACSGDVRGAWKACAEADQWPTAFLLSRELGGEEEYAKCRAAWFKSSKTPALASGIVRVLSKDPEKVVRSGPLKEWKSLAAAAVSWGKGRSAELLSILGDRLKESGDVAAARLCFIGANNFDKLESLGESTIESVRRLLCASRAVGVATAPQSSRLAHHLSTLADSLASQGDMEGAVYWLEQIEKPASAPVEIRLLYERLRAAKAPAVASPAPVTAASRPVGAGGAGGGAVRPPVPVANVQQQILSPTPAVPLPVPQHMGVVPRPSFTNVPVLAAAVPAPLMGGAQSVQQPQTVAPPVTQMAPPVQTMPVPTPTFLAGPVATPTPAPQVMAPTTSAAPAVVQAAPEKTAAQKAIEDMCLRLLNVSEELGRTNDQAKKLADEVAKRMPVLQTKLDSLNETGDLVAVLDRLVDGMQGRDLQAAAGVYAEIQQKYHTHLGSTCMLALKRAVDLMKKL